MADQVLQVPEVELINPDKRIFKSWGSVEVKDLEGDFIPMDEFKKIMPVIMERGAFLSDRHSNRIIGRILNYNFQDKTLDNGEVREGLMLTCQVYKDYEIDDMVWEGLKTGVFKGLSFGGRNKKLDVSMTKDGMANVLKALEGFEFSVVEEMGNQEATVDQINYLAKSKPGNYLSKMKFLIKELTPW